MAMSEHACGFHYEPDRHTNYVIYLYQIACFPPNHDVPWFMGGGPRVVVSTAAFHARVRGSVPGLGGLKETKLFLPHPRVKVSIVGSLRDREVACSASDRQGSNFESCVWRTVSSQSSHHPQEVLLAQFSLYVHKGGLKPDSFCFPPNHDVPNITVRQNGCVFFTIFNWINWVGPCWLQTFNICDQWWEKSKICELLTQRLSTVSLYCRLLYRKGQII